jgi:hypothetical protein
LSRPWRGKYKAVFTLNSTAAFAMLGSLPPRKIKPFTGGALFFYARGNYLAGDSKS